MKTNLEKLKKLENEAIIVGSDNFLKNRKKEEDKEFKKFLQKHKSFLKNAIKNQSFSSFITSEFKRDLIDIEKREKQ